MTATSKTSNPKKTKPVSKPSVVKSKKPKSAPSKPSAASVVVETPVVEDVQSVENVVQKPAEHAIESSMSEVLTSFTLSIQTLSSALAQLKSDFKVLEKQVLKEARTMDKVNTKRNRNKGSRAPSGFVKPASISKELAKFLKVPEDQQMARTDVTKLITAYVKEHKLQDSSNGRKINPDSNLRSLLKVSANEEVTYFNLQKFMKPHFVKTEPVV